METYLLPNSVILKDGSQLSHTKPQLFPTGLVSLTLGLIGRSYTAKNTHTEYS